MTLEAPQLSPETLVRESFENLYNSLHGISGKNGIISDVQNILREYIDTIREKLGKGPYPKGELEIAGITEEAANPGVGSAVQSHDMQIGERFVDGTTQTFNINNRENLEQALLIMVNEPDLAD